MTEDFYGLGPGDVPAFVGMAGDFIAFEELPEKTQAFIAAMLEHMRGLHDENPLAFEAVVGFLATRIDDIDMPT